MSQETIPKATVLVVDDMPSNLKLLMNFLHQAGFKVLIAQDGREGLDVARQAKPDLILLDVMMPGLDGFAVCRQLKTDEQTQHIPVIFMTALADTEHTVIGLRAGGNDYICKPFQQEEVLARMDTHLALARAQRQLEEANTRLERQNETLRALVEVLGHAKNAAEEEIQAQHAVLTSVTQDLRVPMQSLLGNSEALLVQAERAPGSIQTNVGKIAEAGRRVLAFLNDLLDFSRLESGMLKLYPEQFAVAELLTEIQEHMDAMGWTVAENRYLVDIDPAVGTILADRGRLRQILGNLLIHASRFTHQGEIRLFARAIHSADGERVQFTVTDTGLGLSQENQNKILHPFLCVRLYASVNENLGTGMELCLVKRLLQAMQGDMHIHSEPGCGTQVTVTVLRAQNLLESAVLA